MQTFSLFIFIKWQTFKCFDRRKRKKNRKALNNVTLLYESNFSALLFFGLCQQIASKNVCQLEELALANTIFSQTQSSFCLTSRNQLNYVICQHNFICKHVISNFIFIKINDFWLKRQCCVL